MNSTFQRLVKPVYKRQQFLLFFLKELDEPLTTTEFQKLLFLCLTQNNLPYYDFVPYLYGGFSIQAGADINTLRTMGWLLATSEKIWYAGGKGTSLPFKGLGGSILDQLPQVRGNQLVKLVYEQYPYYAINSQIAASIMDAEGIARIRAEKERLKQTEQMLFTIGYEGVSVENYLNTLIKNNIQVLCDVRNNPLSRKFGFSKTNLQKYLKNVGIEYVHIPELGISSEKRNNLSSNEDYQNLFHEYKLSLSKRQGYLERVHQLLLTQNRIALTCFEHESSHCHRHVIREYLKESYNAKPTDL
jgi:uncharacterized protein (DUF488 family)